LSIYLDMKVFYLFLLSCLPLALWSQSRPAYCDGLPATYEKAVALKQKGGGGNGPSKLPRFSTQSISEYKVQVAILRYSEPADHPFHKSLVARYRPCESVWVVESRNSYTDRSRAERLKKELISLGYRGAYITELVGFQ